MFHYRTDVMFARIWPALLEYPSSLMTHLYSLDPNSAQRQCVWRIAGQGHRHETSRPSAGCWSMRMAGGTALTRRLSLSSAPASRCAAPRGASQGWRLCARWRIPPRHHARSATRSASSHEPQAHHRHQRTICCCLCTHVTCCAG